MKLLVKLVGYALSAAGGYVLGTYAPEVMFAALLTFLGALCIYLGSGR